ncbi:putative reverse transcriptase zinc-binding domain-containing protein [Helianthus anomalus]
MGGRLTLIKSVLASLPVYYLSLYKAPVKVTKQIEKMMRNFLWAGSNNDKKMSWVAWKIVTTSKKNGGLGITKIRDVNLALLSKWAWRFKTQKDSLWCKVVDLVHGGRGRWDFLPVNRGIKGCWNTIVKEMDRCSLKGNNIRSLIKVTVGNGMEVQFWVDIWIGSTALKHRWPKMYALEREKNCSVAARFLLQDGGWRFVPNWKRGLASVEELSEMQDMLFLFNNVSFSGSEDRWQWGVDGKESFSVAQVKSLIRDDNEVRRDHSMQWESWIPLKVNLFIWRAEMERIPTKLALTRRRIFIQDVSCSLCETGEEDVNHLFTGCGFSFGVWSAVGKWCKLAPIFAFEFKDLLAIHSQVQGDKWAKKVVKGIIMITCWALWKARNSKVFERVNPKVIEVVAMVKSLPFLWLKNRSRFVSILWKDWVVYPLYML